MKEKANIILKHKIDRLLRIVVILVIGLFLLIISYNILYSFFKIKVIEVSGSNINLIIDEKIIPKILIFFPSESIRTQLLSDFPQLSDVRIEKKLPFTLKITILPRIPIAIIKMPSRYAFVDADAYIFSYNVNRYEKLPFIISDINDLVDGEKLTKPIMVKSLKLLKSFSNLGINYMVISDNNTIKVVIDKTNILISNDMDPETAASTLQIIVSRSRMKGTMPASIDLRYTKPIIVY
jgi:cell division septal protein FtsQ